MRLGMWVIEYIHFIYFRMLIWQDSHWMKMAFVQLLTLSQVECNIWQFNLVWVFWMECMRVGLVVHWKGSCLLTVRWHASAPSPFCLAEQSISKADIQFSYVWSACIFLSGLGRCTIVFPFQMNKTKCVRPVLTPTSAYAHHKLIS